MPGFVELSSFAPVSQSINQSVNRSRKPVKQSISSDHCISDPSLAAAYQMEQVIHRPAVESINQSINNSQETSLDQEILGRIIDHPHQDPVMSSSHQSFNQPIMSHSQDCEPTTMKLESLPGAIIDVSSRIANLPDPVNQSFIDQSSISQSIDPFGLPVKHTITQTITQTTIQTTVQTIETTVDAHQPPSNNQTASTSIGQSVDQKSSQSTTRSSCQSMSGWFYRIVPVGCSINQSISQTISQFLPSSKPTEELESSINQSLNIEIPRVSSSTVTHDVSEIPSIDYSINQPSYMSSIYNNVIPTINQSINQSINLSINGLQSVTNTMKRSFFFESKTDSEQPSAADLEHIKQMIDQSINHSVYQPDESISRHPDSELKIETQYEFIDQSEIESINQSINQFNASIQHTIDLASIDWWKFLNPLTEYGELTSDSIDSDSDDGYVIVTHNEAQESLSSFISAIIASHPHAAKMTAVELRQLIDQALQPSQGKNRLVSYGYYAYYAWSWSSTASRMYSRMWMVRVAAQGAARAAGWMVFVL